MAAHATFPPSSSATWLPCPYSARNAVPEQPKPRSTVEAGDEGTRVHALLEDWHATGELPSEDDPGFTAASMWAKFVGKLEQGKSWSEKRVTISDDCWGTVDLLNEHPQITTVMDYKNGKWDVSAYHNAQMLTYAAAELDSNPAPWWRFVIFQPNGLQGDGDLGFKQWVAARAEVEGHKAKVLEALKDDSPPKPGPHCRWCKAFHTCPAMSTDAGFVMGAISRRVEDLTPEEIVRLLRLIRALSDLKPAYEDVLTTYLKVNGAVEGATLKRSTKWRVWNDERQAAEKIAELHGVGVLKPPSVKTAEGLSPEIKQYVSVATRKPEGEMKASY